MTPPTRTSLSLLPGHPALLEAIHHELAAGPLPFARFMELALYHPEYGYYTRPASQDEDRHLAEDRIGWQGDFYTSSDVDAFLATALARQAAEIDERLGRPDPFTVVEMGPGKGLLARDFIQACEREMPAFCRRLQYRLIDRSTVMREAQARVLAPWAGRIVQWDSGLRDCPDGGLVGLFLSNELVDAFPVHRVQIVDRRLREIYVAAEDGAFVETAGDLSTPELQEFVHTLSNQGVVLEEGAIADINLEALRWMREVGRMLGRGVAITIDYGHTAADLYDSQRRRGTLLCYYHQTASEDPYSRVGFQDMTAHVDFTALARAGEAAGLSITGFTNQMSFLMSWGIEEELTRHEPGSPAFQSLVHLLRPEGMGRAFKILVQHKGCEPGELTGLRYRPFFGAALGMAGADRAPGGPR